MIISIAAGQSDIGTWTTYDNGMPTERYGASFSLTGAGFLAWCAIVLLYYFLAELMTGRSLGKHIMKLKVITVGGRPPGVRAVLLRTLDGSSTCCAFYR